MRARKTSVLVGPVVSLEHGEEVIHHDRHPHAPAKDAQTECPYLGVMGDLALSLLLSLWGHETVWMGYQHRQEAEFLQ